jgi:hypothetical protein
MGGNASVLLWVVLGLVLVSFVLLVVALATTTTGWAWGSVAASGLAGALLGAEWVARRRSAPSSVDADTDPVELGDRFTDEPATAAPVPPAVEPAGAPPDGDVPTGSSGEPASIPRTGVDGDGATTGTDEPEPERGVPAPVLETPGRELDSDGRELDQSAEPAEERTDVGDAIAIADLPDEVRVIDERPRYHLGNCRWVGARETIPLAVSEARELGFTPCAICRPDSTLAARSRAART